jgi:hypothetical protein
MFVGLPFNYRKSVLADVALSADHRLEQVVCRNPSVEAQEVSPQSEMQFEVQIVRVSGVPSEEESRKDDVLHRGVRFSICQTNKPPTHLEPGNPPEFLGNVTKLHATVHPSRPDTWQFSNEEEMDPDKSCFVRCSSTDMYRGDSATEMHDNRNNNQRGTPLEELYLFVELTTTVRVIPNNARGKRRKVHICICMYTYLYMYTYIFNVYICIYMY